MLAANNDYFTTLETAQRLDLIRHLVENSELVPLVRGPKGIGKSLLAYRLQQVAPENWSICHFEADANMSPDHLLVYIARCAGLTEIKSDPLESLIRQFEAMRRKGRLPVLLVDDAHRLPPTSLITLLRLYEKQLAGEPLVSMVLFGDEQIDMLLSTPQLRIMSPQAIQVIDLPAFNREDATAYMHYLLEAEGLSADLELDDLKLTKIYRETEGIPGLLRQKILAAIADEDLPSKPNHEGILKRLVYSLPVVLIAALIITFQDEINQLFESPESLTREELLTVKEQVFEVPSVVQPEAVSIEQKVVLAPLIKTDTPSPDQPEMMAPLLSDEMADAGESESVTAIDEAQSAPVPEEAEMPVVEAQEQSDTEPVERPIPQESLAEDLSVVVEAPKQRSVSQARQSEEVAVVVAPESGDAASPVKTEAARDREWILSRPAGHQTIQILGVGSYAAIKAFIEKNDLQEAAFYIQTQRNGKPWFSLLWGDFPDKTAAMNGSRQLPDTIQKEGIWVRSFGAIQKTAFNTHP